MKKFLNKLMARDAEVAVHTTKGKLISVQNSWNCIYMDCPNVVIDVIEEIISEI